MTKSVSDETAVIPGLAEDLADRDDGLADELAAAAPRYWWNRGTLVLGVMAVLLGGFLGGIQVQKHYGTAATAAAPGGAGFPTGGAGLYGGRFPGNGGGLGGPSGAPAATAAAGTTGTVKLVDGSTLYVQTADGTVVTVRTSANTAVRTAAKAKLKDLKAGEPVTVAGAADAAGTVTATSVTAQPK